jgi:hypothetical protein
VTDLYFADPSDGYVFGPGLETTHDGGQTWRNGAPPPLTQVTASDGYVFALSALWSARRTVPLSISIERRTAAAPGRCSK